MHHHRPLLLLLLASLFKASSALCLMPSSGSVLLSTPRRCNTRLFGGFALVSSKGPSKGAGEGAGDGGDGDGEATRVLELTEESICPCGSKLNYGACCRPLHKGTVKALEPISLIRSRYSAYSLENLDYIIETTSTNSPDYLAYIESPIGARNGRKKWIKDVRKNMIDSFAYVRMEIDGVESDAADAARAVVSYRHLAIKKADNIMYPILEKAFLIKTDGVWYYEKGEVMRPEAEQSQTMMNEWPALAGLQLKRDPVSTLEEGSAAPAERQPRPVRPAPKMGSAAPPQRVAKGKR